MFVVRVGIAAHRMKRHRVNREGRRFVEVHVFHKSVCIEKIITGPAGWQRWLRARIKFEVHILPGSEDDEFVVNVPQQRSHVSIAGVAASLWHKGTSTAHLLVVIVQVSWRASLNLPRVAPES